MKNQTPNEKISKSPTEIFKGLSVRAEYGKYRYDDEMEEAQTVERVEHGTLQTRRILQQEKPTKHIAQGLYW